MSKTRSVSFTVLLVVAIGGLVATASGAVLVLSAYANFKNTSELVLTSAQSFMDSLEADIRVHLSPAESIVRFLAARSAEGKFDPADRQAAVPLLKGTLAAAPQVSDVTVWEPNGRELVVSGNETGHVKVGASGDAASEDLAAYLDTVRDGVKLTWDAPFRVDNATLISAAAPLFRDSRHLGTAAAGISVAELSALVRDLGEAYGVSGFILYGKDQVLGHEGLLGLPVAGLNADEPLHRVSSLRDPILLSFLSTKPSYVDKEKAFVARDVAVDGRDYIILSRKLEGFGNVPWVLGAYSPKSDWDAQFRRLTHSIVGGVLLFGLAVLAAIVLARRIASPVRQIAEANLKVGALDLEEIEYLPPSHISEINDQATAFNQMLDGLRWFETYVPRTLVRSLVRQQSNAAVESREVMLTVMFTDIVGFTADCETKSPSEIADMLNRHFETLNRCIEAEGGTLDKYIGDAVMAFWGAPVEQPDHAERACRAALAMARALKADGEGERIKIAIHTGPLVVGNIGAKARMNYTVIGDTVNTCSRIEKLAGDLDDGEPAIILISDTTAAELSEDVKRTRVGEFTVKGKSEPVVVYRLQGDQ